MASMQRVVDSHSYNVAIIGSCVGNSKCSGGTWARNTIQWHGQVTFQFI